MDESQSKSKKKLLKQPIFIILDGISDTKSSIEVIPSNNEIKEVSLYSFLSYNEICVLRNQV